MKNWKKYLAAAIACGAMFSLQPATSDAAYQLSDEVNDATPALLDAAQIGVMVNENADLSLKPNKDAILVMSFGTTFPDSRAVTIDATADAIKAAHPGVKVVTAYTSHIIIDRVKENEGISIPTPEEAIEQLKSEGYTRVAMTNLNIIPGMEYTYDLAVYRQYRNDFKKATFGTPLMYWMGQEEQADDVAQVMEAYATQFPKMGKEDAVLILEHGTPHPANAYYSVMQNRLNQLGYDNVYIYTVEGWPSLDDIIPQLKKKGVKNITLMPMMMVAGDHANNDMAGDEDDSHKMILQDAGFNVTPYIHGVGENEAVREIFVQRAHEAYKALVD